MKINSTKNLSALLPLFIFILGIFLNSASADTIKLKDGKEISGYLYEINDTNVILEIRMGDSYGKVGFRREAIESINNLSIEEAEARLATKDAFILKDKDKTLASSAKEGINFVSKTRKLEFKDTPEIAVVTKGKIKENLKKQIEKNYSKEKLETRGKLLLKLGIITDREEYENKVLELVGEQVAGYYDPDEKKIYVTEAVMDDMLPGLPSITLMHEQVHALQDQYFNLKNIEEAALSASEDKGLAIKSVIEGEATVLMYDAFFRSFSAYGLGSSNRQFDLRSFVIDSMLAYSKRFKTDEGRPAIFMEDLLFPYVYGGSFIQFTVNIKGWEAVDTIYKDLPVSSEQIMHPEKYYIVRDEPKKVTIPDVSGVLGESWLKLTENTLGEFDFYLIGKVFLDELSSKVMSEGWGGDSYALYEEPNSKSTLFISLSKWDSERDADEFFTLYKKILEKKYKELALVKEEQNFAQWKIEAQNVYIAKSKERVVIIEGAPDNLLSGLKEALVI